MELLFNLARGAIALLVAAIAIYFTFKLLGKLAKFVITVIIVAAVLWFLFSNPEIVAYIKQLFAGLLAGRN